MARIGVFRPRWRSRRARQWVPTDPGSALELEGYRVRNDDGSETTATWLEVQDTKATVNQEVGYRNRVIINNPPAGPFPYLWRARRSDSSPKGAWFDVEPE